MTGYTAVLFLTWKLPARVLPRARRTQNTTSRSARESGRRALRPLDRPFLHFDISYADGNSPMPHATYWSRRGVHAGHAESVATVKLTSSPSGPWHMVSIWQFILKGPPWTTGGILVAKAYTDVFRCVPTSLLTYLIGDPVQYIALLCATRKGDRLSTPSLDGTNDQSNPHRVIRDERRNTPSRFPPSSLFWIAVEAMWDNAVPREGVLDPLPRRHA
ncbi:hypothetical protein GE09DRAFT_356645 [Coniochaeta sp. 2T2.1]|nr:hypothetical protein GE09DRAFT_356645 [Coniochaeta sp. 2T2.1]